VRGRGQIDQQNRVTSDGFQKELEEKENKKKGNAGKDPKQ